MKYITCTVDESCGSGGFAESLAVTIRLYTGKTSLSNSFAVKIVPLFAIVKSWASSPDEML